MAPAAPGCHAWSSHGPEQLEGLRELLLIREPRYSARARTPRSLRGLGQFSTSCPYSRSASILRSRWEALTTSQQLGANVGRPEASPQSVAERVSKQRISRTPDLPGRPAIRAALLTSW
ncbi:hypothetical protein SBADM41S_09411 [Streptomyces badius]